jgi:hypothetical protein
MSDLSLLLVCYTLGTYKILTTITAKPKIGQISKFAECSVSFLTFISQFDLVLLLLYLF